MGQIVVELLAAARVRRWGGAEASPPVSGEAGALHPPGPHVAVPAPHLHLAARAAALAHRGGGHQAAGGLRETRAGRLLGRWGAGSDSVSLEIGKMSNCT